MSNIKKGSKLTVSTNYGISRDTSNNLGVLEVSGPAMSDIANVYGTNPGHLVIGATDASGILQLGINSDGNTFIDANTHNNHKDIIMQKYGGNFIVGSGANSQSKVGIQTNAPNSTFHINSTDGLIIPVGTNGERPNPAYNGMIRYNTSTSQFEGYGPGSAWGSLGGVKDVDGDTYILAETSAGADNDDLQFYTGGSERMVIDSSGYVGIGNSNPQTELDISGQITANTKEYTHEIEFNSNNSYDNWILFNSSYGNAGEVPVNTDWTIEYKHKITFGPSVGDGYFGIVLEEDGIDSSYYYNNTHFLYYQTDPSTNLTFRYEAANNSPINEIIPGTGYRWSLFSDHVDVKWEFLTKNNTIRLYFNGENVKTMSNLTNPSKIFGRWGFVELFDNTHNIINPRITYGGKTYHLTTQYSTSTTAPTLTTTTKNVELINSTNNQINIPKLHSTELYADKMFVGRNNFNDYTFNAERKLVASDGAGSSFFGNSISIDGNYAIVGAVYSDDIANNSGSAYIFNVQTGEELHKLKAEDAAAADYFGESVAISGNYAIIGARGDESNRGSAYIFSVLTGKQIYKLVAQDGESADSFGESVSISGNYAIVGAPSDDDGANVSGAAYIFNVQTGAELYKIKASDREYLDNFGCSVAISGNYAIVGAKGNDDVVDDSGSAYIFNVTTREELHKLVVSGPVIYDNFGESVAISGNYAIVGSYGYDTPGTTDSIGAAYIFNVQTGELLHKVTAGDAESGDTFSRGSVAISGNYAIIGAKDSDDAGNFSGSAYIFDVQTGMQVKKITASDAAASDQFGSGVAIFGNYVIVGAQGDNSNQGAAYIYGPTASSSYLLNINDDGHIGIGTSEPKTELHVQGAITTDKLYAGTGAPTDYTFSIEKKLLAHDGAASDRLGWRVAIDGDYAIVASYEDDSQKGSAYIYNVHTGAEICKLVAEDAATGDRFGRSVAIYGNYAMAGTIFHQDTYASSGSAYIFNAQTGEQIHKLVASDQGLNYYFGQSIDIDGNYAIIGSHGHSSLRGAAYIFNVQTGTQLRKLTASDGVANDLFGFSVAISGNYAIVGARDHHTNGVSDSGAAYIFNIHTGEQLHKLTAVSGGSGHEFGYAVAIDGNYAVVGEPRDSDNGTNSGSVHVFNVQTGELLYKVIASDGGGGDLFGESVAISGNYFIVGAYLDNLSGLDEGSAYIFDVRTGMEVKKITASDAAGSDQFGISVAISGNYVIVGAHQDNSSQGSAYIYGPNDPLPPLLSIDNDSGNVGIGTTEPKSLLDVNGTLQATTLTSTNLKVGRDFSFSVEKKLLASDGAADDNSGFSVAIDGDYAIVGTYKGLGYAYIYNVHTGAEIHKLVASDGVGSEEFGYSVAISGNYAIVGSRHDDDINYNCGSAYIFNVQTGEQLHKLLASDKAAYDAFGTSVAISGNYAIVGAPYDHNNGYTDNGAAYIFNVQTGQELKKVVAQDQRSSLRFANDVAIDGNYAAASGWLDTTKGSNAGAVYIFNVPNGDILHKIVPDDLVANDEFGRRVAISGIYGVFSAHTGDDNGADSGVVYVYNIQTGNQLYKLLASDGAAGDLFGVSVDIDGNYVILGSYRDDDNGLQSGSAYIFDVRTGAQVKKILASDGAASDEFGYSAAISGNYVIVGAPYDDDKGADSGAAYIYGPSSPYLLSIEDGVTDIPNLVTTGLTSGNFNAGRDFSFSDETKVLAHDGAGSDQFGISVAIDGDYAIVGAFRDDTYRGGAYIYNVHTGAEIRKLTASDGVANDYFGKSVGIDGNYVIVGAYGDDSWAGSAYIFDVRTGTQLHKLTENGRVGNEDFGVSVAISGNYAIVGASHDDDNGSNSGAAYIFNVQTGELHHELTPLDRVASDFFGWRVAISGNYAIVAAFKDDDKGTDSGSAYIFNVQTGTQLRKLLASDGAASDQFGYHVAIDGDYAIVGAPYDHNNGYSDNGSAYIFNVQTGTELHKLTASDGATGDRFGESVAISGNYAIIGSFLHNSLTGSVYIFDVRTGHQVKKITPSDGVSNYRFGNSVAISGNYAIIGSYFDNTIASTAGSAYIYGPSSPSLLSIDNDSRNMNIVGGNVGIGTTSPEYPLHLQTTIVRNDSGTLGYLPSSGSTTTYSFPQTHIGAQISIKASGSIWSDIYMLVGSDRRIKEKIEEVPDALALQQVRTIPCKYYEYKDKYKKGFGKTIGFIAQEVREILPMAISLQTDFVPDEMRVLTDISWNGTTLYTDISGSSARYRFYVSDDLSGNGAIEKEITGSGSTGFKFDKQYNFVFCYGKKVNDFHTVDKSKIFALNFAATQELDRIQQQQIIDISNANTTIQTLQTDLSNANTIIQQQATTIQQQATTIQTLETQIADILTRLSNLENTGSA